MRTAYGYNPRMTSLDKLKRKLAENPRGVRFAELVRVLRDLGYEEVRVKGSHHVFRPDDGRPSLVIVRPHGGRHLCAWVDVSKVLALLENEE